jgi:hypothetical protein
MRQEAKKQGKSLNRIAIETFQKVYGRNDEQVAARDSDFSWFVGSGMDEETLKALEDQRRHDKKYSRAW